MIKVTFGEHDRCDDSMRPETRFVLRAISQKFSYSNFDNDMALLRLNDRVPITDYIRPICLPSNKGNYVISPLLAAIATIKLHCLPFQSLVWGENRVESLPVCDRCHRFHNEKRAMKTFVFQRLSTSWFINFQCVKITFHIIQCQKLAQMTTMCEIPSIVYLSVSYSRNIRGQNCTGNRMGNLKRRWQVTFTATVFSGNLMRSRLGKPSCILQEVEVPVMSNTDCTTKTNYTSKMITNNMLCAGYPGVGQKDSCQGLLINWSILSRFLTLLFWFISMIGFSYQVILVSEDLFIW